ncbi:hypothetical protein VTK73DRAFT_7642 [Phialemonium thermophilum]|uniref:Uncharacterized protein n=1 Tax=Phialemonium thermophilum TaxID=223376 RepID=A0ABR3Y6G9_9PEZI
MGTIEDQTTDAKSLPLPSPTEPLSVVETPTSPSAGFALSRFEFETGKGIEGTKILMVEWDTTAVLGNGGISPPADGVVESSTSLGRNGDNWEITWEGKASALPIRDAEVGADGDGPTNRRVYFLLPPGTQIPTMVSIAYRPAGAQEGGSTGGGARVLRTKPLPAIFPAELAGGRDVAGRRGVLHTIWANRRLEALQAEIAAEMRTNGESVGLEMAIQERQWIVDHFGLAPVEGVPQPTRLHIPQQQLVPGPASPRSPVGGRLGEKLRGLRLATSPTELAAAAQAARAATKTSQSHVGLGDQDSTDSSLSYTAMTAYRTSHDSKSNGIAPGVVSLDAVLGSGTGRSKPAAAESGDNEEDLFALPMSPRSPDMKKSPFSII